jgi:hypothetical protein
MDSLISEAGDCGDTPSESKSIGTANLASEKCYGDSKCTAYQFTDGQVGYFTAPISNSCKAYFKDSNHKDQAADLIRQSVFRTSTVDPVDADTGDGWLNTTDGSVWNKTRPYDNKVLDALRPVWAKVETLGVGVSWGKGIPSNAQQGTLYIDYTNPTILRLYEKVENTWTPLKTIRGPGVNVDASASFDTSKTVGFRETYHKQWLLYLAIGLLIVGLIGIVVTNKGGGGKGLFSKKAK